ncbi:RNA-directed DNA polymerase, eukaryota, reverse transcriptase zinc-binding domain protein [Tanacetum coccineum]|uniref:RNA-directed DNA polymerase, eukaryota, reverse transcriptase zinc-binding domain protein n=1 Tax=Tanacetum coccineum TaxID=301880 RepID=A0ABQ5DA98_9ASTR
MNSSFSAMLRCNSCLAVIIFMAFHMSAPASLSRISRPWSIRELSGCSGDFSIASVRKLIDEYMLSEVAAKTRWTKAVPIKVNVLLGKERGNSSMGKSTKTIDSNGWTWIFRNNNTTPSKPIGNLLYREVDKVATSFYVTNFPDSIDSKGLWNACTPYGRLIGSFNLYVSVARFQRPNQNKSNEVFNNKPNPNSNPKNTSHNHNDLHSEKPSFASIVHGNPKISDDDTFTDKTRVVSLNDQDLISIDDTSKVLLVKLKDLGSASNMYVICKNEGFVDPKIHHVGGSWIWIQFLTPDACEAFRSNDTMKSISSSIKTVSPSFMVDERLIWIEISGLPLCAWGSNAFKKVACLLGKFMFFEVEQNATMCIGTWSINIMDESIDTSSSEDKNEIKKVVDTFDDNPTDDLEDIIQNLNNDKENKGTNAESPKVNVGDLEPAKEENASDLSCPPGFEHLKRGSSSRCFTSFSKRQNKGIKGISFIHEFSRVIEVGGSLGLDVRGVQESKMTRLETFRLKSMRGNYSFDYACSLARARSGGLISMWDPKNFVKEDIWCDDAFIIIKGQWKNTIRDCYMVNLYGPHDPLAKNALWNRIRDFMQLNMGKYILFGDMNEVRNAQECYGSIFSRNESEVFNNFINDSNLTGPPFGRTFVYLDEQTSPRLLVALKILEDKIKAGSPSNDDHESRINLLHEVDKLDNFEVMDTIQKARIKCDIKGDENSKFFHSLINKKRKGNLINGILHEGVWVIEPRQIKEVFLNFFKQKFQANDSLIDFLSSSISSRLNACD